MMHLAELQAEKSGQHLGDSLTEQRSTLAKCTPVTRVTRPVHPF